MVSQEKNKLGESEEDGGSMRKISDCEFKPSFFRAASQILLVKRDKRQSINCLGACEQWES